MPNVQITSSEAAEVAAIVERDGPKIMRAADRIVHHLVGLDPVSQKQALARAFAAWVVAMTDPDDADTAFALSESLHYQVDLYLSEIFATRLPAH